MNQTLSDNQELLVLSSEIKDLLTTINHTTQAVKQITTGVNTNSDRLQQLLTLSDSLRASLSNQTTQIDSLDGQIAGGQVVVLNKMSEIIRKLPVGTDVIQQQVDTSELINIDPRVLTCLLLVIQLVSPPSSLFL